MENNKHILIDSDLHSSLKVQAALQKISLSVLVTLILKEALESFKMPAEGDQQRGQQEEEDNIILCKECGQNIKICDCPPF